MNTSTKQRYFCTLFDKNYLIKGVAMLRSAVKHSPEAKIWVLCMDDVVFNLLSILRIKGVTPVRYEDFSTPQLAEIRETRSIAEFCWTLSSVFTSYVMDKNDNIDCLTYLDADLYFFSSVESVFKELEDASIGAIEHRYTPRLSQLEAYGIFNVQWVSFRRDDQGIACLAKWRDQCIDWCYSILEEGKFGDQKYLDSWPGEFNKFRSIKNIGAGLAPWNYSNYTIERRGEVFLVNSVPLVFYHFHQFQILDSGEYDCCSSNYTQDGPPPQEIYEAYSMAISEALTDLRSIEPNFSFGIRNSFEVRGQRFAQRYLPGPVKNLIHKFMATLKRTA